MNQKAERRPKQDTRYFGIQQKMFFAGCPGWWHRCGVTSFAFLRRVSCFGVVFWFMFLLGSFVRVSRCIFAGAKKAALKPQVRAFKSSRKGLPKIGVCPAACNPFVEILMAQKYWLLIVLRSFPVELRQEGPQRMLRECTSMTGSHRFFGSYFVKRDASLPRQFSKTLQQVNMLRMLP